MSLKINFKWKKFSELSLQELYDALMLRQQVFVVEQECIFNDSDGFDKEAYHLLGYNHKKLVAYLRAFPPNILYKGTSIGRIVIKDSLRKKNLGRDLTLRGINFLKSKYPDQDIYIGAQYRLKKFYNDIGFLDSGDIYIEDDIEHIKMILKLN